MLISRCTNIIRNVNLLAKRNANLKVSSRLSHGGWNYRTGPPPASKNVMLLAEAVQGFAWWWVLWHLWTQFDHISGEFDYPDPSKWTDEELGIPAVD